MKCRRTNPLACGVHVDDPLLFATSGGIKVSAPREFCSVGSMEAWFFSGLAFGKSGRLEHHHYDRCADEKYAERSTQTTAEWNIFFGCHYQAEPKHPSEAGRAGGKHHEHERPATADTIESVLDADPEGFARYPLPAPA